MYMHLGMVIFDILDIRGHTKVKVYSEYHHAINGYWVVDNLGDSWSTSRVIGPVTEITKVTQNNTGMYTQGSSQQTFEIPNDNLDVKLEKAYQNHNNEILRTRKENKISHNL